MEMQNLLRQLPMFQALTDEERDDLAGMNYIFRRYQEGEIIVRQGDRGNSFFILLKGMVFIAFDGQFFLKLKPGAVFGEVAFLVKSTLRISSVVCGSKDAITMEVDENTYRKFNPAVREKIWNLMLQVMARKLFMMNQENITLQKLLTLVSASAVNDPQEIDDGWGCPETYQQCRRTRKRFLFEMPVYLDLEDGVTISGNLRNLSATGAFVVTVEEPSLQKNQKGKLGLLRHRKIQRDRQVIYPCVVAWVDPFGFGLQWRFHDMLPSMDVLDTRED